MAQVVGLDIGTSAVRAAELEFGSGAPVLVAFGQVGLPPGAIVDGEVQDLSAVSDAIAACGRTASSSRSPSSSASPVCVPSPARSICPGFPTRTSTVPCASSPKRSFLSRLTRRSSPRRSFPTTPRPTAPRPRRVLVAAAHRDLVDGVVGAAENGGPHRRRRRPRLFCLGPSPRRPLGGRRTPRGHRFHRRRPDGRGRASRWAPPVRPDDRYGRQRRHGGSGVSARPSARRCRGDQATSRRGLSSGAIGRDRGAAGHRRAGGRDPQLGPVLRHPPGSGPDCSRPSHRRGSPPAGTGQGAAGRRCAFPSKHVSPLARLDLSKIDLDPEQAASIEPVLATPIGLALPEPNPSVKKFNLVPPEVTQRAFERSVIRKAFMAAAAVVLLLVGVSAWRFLQVRSARNGVTNLHAVVAGLNEQIPKYDKVVAINNELRLAKSQVSGLANTAVDWSAVVAQLSTRIPTGLSVITFTGTAGAPSGRGSRQYGDGCCRHSRRNRTGRRGDRNGVGGAVRQLPELCPLRSRGPVDRQSHRLSDVQPARRECGRQHSGRQREPR